MEVIELFNLTEWVKKEVESEKYGNLLQNYHQFMAGLQNSTAGQPFADQRKHLEDALEAINFATLTRDQKDFLEKISLLETLGKPAIDKIENILTHNKMDVATAVNTINEMIGNLDAGLKKLEAIQEGLRDYIPDDYDEIHDEEGVLTRLSFLESASINNIVDFKKSANNWHLIGIGLAEISDLRPEDIKIIGASRGSIIFDLWLSLYVAKLLGKIILLMLKSTETFYKIKKIQQEIRGLEIDNERKKKFIEPLHEDEGLEKNKIIEKTVEEVAKSSKISPDKKVKLEKAVELLFEFLDDGGNIDFVLPRKEESEEGEVAEDDELLNFNNNVQETRSLMEDMKRIKDMSSENDSQQEEQSNDEQKEE